MWLVCVHAYLLQEKVKRKDQILDEVEVVVVHVGGHHDRAWGFAVVVQVT